MNKAEMDTSVNFRIRRTQPDSSSTPRWSEFTVAYNRRDDRTWMACGKSRRDSTLPCRGAHRAGWASADRVGCSSTGQPRLGCNTQISELRTSTVTVEPLPNFPIIRDLVPDLSSMFDPACGSVAVYRPLR